MFSLKSKPKNEKEDIFEKIIKEKAEIEKVFGEVVTAKLNEYEKMLLPFDLDVFG